MRAARVASLLAAAVGAVLLFVPVTWGGFRCGSAAVPGPPRLADLSAGLDGVGGMGGAIVGMQACQGALDWVRLVAVVLLAAGVVAVLLLSWALGRRRRAEASTDDGVPAR
ncbi:hypothetical protein [Pseudokineococcus sp. 1T1Z-3]|uniref:hypothetical protein n=1 Tax=Pseudokineococcus sp. 1T1Z-3 TaxID=3132745 RepID=UPI0030A38A00